MKSNIIYITPSFIRKIVIVLFVVIIAGIYFGNPGLLNFVPGIQPVQLIVSVVALVGSFIGLDESRFSKNISMLFTLLLIVYVAAYIHTCVNV
jgi:hypothetical protein